MINNKKSHLRWFPRLTLMAFLLPILIGLLGTWLPSFGYLPAIGSKQLSFDHWVALFQHPTTIPAISMSLRTGLISSLLALGLSLWLSAALYRTKSWDHLIHWLSPMLATPHAAFAIGFLFLIAPSGWLMRLISPEISGFTRPPDWSLIRDPEGISLILVLLIKELPFLLLMIISATHQIQVDRQMVISQSLGYNRIQSWINIIVPQIWPQLRLPFMAVLAFSLSTVDLALLAGPSTPSTFAILVNRWFNDPDTNFRLIGAAGATTLLLIVIFTLIIVWLLEKLSASISHRTRLSGKRKNALDSLSLFATPLALLLSFCSLMSLFILLLWSLTQRWRFPQAFPQQWSIKHWIKAWEPLQPALLNTLMIGFFTVCIALVLVIGCLEYERHNKEYGQSVKANQLLFIIYIPLLIPQIAFVFGLQSVLVWLNVDGLIGSVIVGHLIFVVPYSFLTLSAVYRQFDQRYILQAISLRPSRWAAFWHIKLPMLAAPIYFTMATGFAVSVAQYLITLYIGAGRVSTVTTETITLSSGSDRRIIAVYALIQFLMPLIVYILALSLPKKNLHKTH